MVTLRWILHVYRVALPLRILPHITLLFAPWLRYDVAFITLPLPWLMCSDLLLLLLFLPYPLLLLLLFPLHFCWRYAIRCYIVVRYYVCIVVLDCDFDLHYAFVTLLRWFVVVRSCTVCVALLLYTFVFVDCCCYYAEILLPACLPACACARACLPASSACLLSSLLLPASCFLACLPSACRYKFSRAPFHSVPSWRV